MGFKEDFDQMLQSQRNEMKARWNRVLPTNELMYDRWQKARDLGFGEDSSIYDTSVVMGDIQIGAHVWIGPFTLLEGLNGRLEIGDYCHISTGVQIVTHDSVESVLTGGKAPFRKGDVRIGPYTYIGGATLIRHGVTIGHHCVIGAHSFVNRDIPDYAIAFGAPARVVGRVVIEDDKVLYEYYSKKADEGDAEK